MYSNQLPGVSPVIFTEEGWSIKLQVVSYFFLSEIRASVKAIAMVTTFTHVSSVT